MSAKRWVLTTVTTLLVFVTATCSTSPTNSNGGGGGGGTPSISITISGATLTVTQGENGQVTVSLTRSGGFTGTVTLTAEGLPSGVTAGSGSIGSGSTSGTLQIDVSPTATPGTFTGTIRATGSGVSAATATFTLVVQEGGGGETPSISITLSGATLAITQGENGQISATLARSGGFTGGVTLSAEGLPTGVTAGTDEISAGETSGTVQVDVSPTATPGTFTVTIRAAGTGVDDATATFMLTVNQSSGGGGGNITYSYCEASDLPAFFAYKDGNGGWVSAQPNGNSYSFSLPSGHGGVAWVDGGGGAGNVQVFLGTEQELEFMGGTECTSGSTGKTVNGTVAGLAPGDQASISVGSAAAAVASPGTNFTLMNVPDGIVDLIASASELVINGQDVSLTLKKMIIRRNLNPADGSMLPVLDFSSGEAFDPVFRNLTINNLNGEMALATSLFFTSNLATAGTFFTDFQLSTETMRMFPAVPANQFQAGDLQLVGATALGDMSGAKIRTTMTMSGSPVDQTVNLGPAIDMLDVSVAATAPYVLPQIMYDVQMEYGDYWIGSFSQGSGNSLSVGISANYLDGAGTLDVTAPDFSGLAGWNNAWGLQPGQETSWGFTATGWTGAQGIFSAPFADGVTWQTATMSDQFTP